MKLFYSIILSLIILSLFITVNAYAEQTGGAGHEDESINGDLTVTGDLSATDLDGIVGSNTPAVGGFTDLTSNTLGVTQSFSLGDSGAMTLTVSESLIHADLTCTGSTPTPIVVTEGGSEQTEAIAIITNIAAKTCSFADNSAVLELCTGTRISTVRCIGLRQRLPLPSMRLLMWPILQTRLDALAIG